MYLEKKYNAIKTVLVLATFTLITTTRKKVVKNVEMDKIDENSKNGKNSKNEKKVKYLKSNLIWLLYI